MKHINDQDQQVSSYLFNEMSNNERQEFENKINNNKILLNELLLGKKVNDSIKKEIQVSDFKKKLEGIHEREFGKPKTKVINISNKWYWAAASITLLSGSAYFSAKKHTSQPNYLFNKYYQVWEPAMITRQANDNNIQNKILITFEQGNYTKVLELINNLTIEHQSDARLVLTKGCALMELDNYNKAIVEFEKFNNNDFTLYTDASNWYKALCYIRLEQLNEAKFILETIVKYKSAYSADAKDLLKKIS